MNRSPISNIRQAEDDQDMLKITAQLAFQLKREIIYKTNKRRHRLAFWSLSTFIFSGNSAIS